MPEKKINILVAPLDWGIGHATRCVPIIRMLLQKGANVILAASGQGLAFLKLTFPETDLIRSEGIRVIYPEKGGMAMKMALSAPSFLAGIYRDHRWLQDFIKKQKIDAVISDNRFGFWSNRVPSVYLTHQLVIRMPDRMGLLEPFTWMAHRQFIKKYTECWIPDTEDEMNLSGDLSHKYRKPTNAHYIGPLTRFVNIGKEGDSKQESYDLLVMLSGPEPQRSMLERIVRRELKKKPDLRAAMLQGLPAKRDYQEAHGGLKVYSHLPDHKMAGMIRNASMVLCRPGYSTLMDLACLEKRALLVPTPGQTEQEYLGRYHAKQGWHQCVSQRRLNIGRILAAMQQETHSPPVIQTTGMLEQRVEVLLQRIRYHRVDHL